MTETAPEPKKFQMLKPGVIGFLVFVVAFLVRIYGVSWGLPTETHHWSRHPDEPVIWLYSQQIKPAEGKFTPSFYNYGTLYLTMLKVSTDVVNGYGGGPSAKDGSDQWQALGRYHLAGRILSVLAGAGMAWVVVLMLWRRTHWLGSVFGGLAVTFAPGLVIHSKFQTVDVMATFFLCLGLYYAIRLVPGEGDGGEVEGKRFLSKLEPSLRFALASGLFFGLSAGTKYTGLLGLLALAVVCIAGKKWKELAAGVAVCFVTFLVTTPGMVLDSEKFWKDFSYEMAHTSQGHGLVFAGTSSGFIYHLGNLALGFGPILLLLGIVGLGRAVSRKHLWALALVVFAVAYYILIGRAEVKFLRYTFPLIPILAVGGGWLVGRSQTHPNKKMRGLVVGGILGIGGLLGGGAGLSLPADFEMSSSNGQGWAVQVIDELAEQPISAIGLVSDPWFYTIDLYPEAGAPRWVPFSKRNAEMLAFPANVNPRGIGKNLRNAKILRFVPENPDQRIDWDVRLIDQKPEFIVFSSFETEGLDRLIQQNNVPVEFQGQVENYSKFIKRLQSEYRLLTARSSNPFATVHDLMYIRPNIYIWKRKTDLPKQ